MSLSTALYTLGLKTYFGVIRLIAPIHRKAQLMVKGRDKIIDTLRESRCPNDRYIWIHAASLGEFEQGRPLIEMIKKNHPDLKICLTFFSPSGYEVRKDYPLADIVTYIPFDTSDDLKHFIKILAPEKAIFVKYEIWLKTLNLLHQYGIESYLISAIFRPDQIFFKPYGHLFRKALRQLTHIYVQDKRSLSLLEKIGVQDATICGDTRIDRVISIADQNKPCPSVEALSNTAHQAGQKVIIAGSSWEKDEDIYLPQLISDPQVRIIIAPHEIHEAHINHIQSLCKEVVVTKLSETTPEEVRQVKVLIIDQIGLLSSIYRYGDIAYIGGGFGRGIHNTPEAAVYGIPVIFGPNYHKFREAHDMIDAGGAFTIKDKHEFKAIISRLLSEDHYRQHCGERAGAYIHAQAGSTQRIYEGLFEQKRVHKS